MTTDDESRPRSPAAAHASPCRLARDPKSPNTVWRRHTRAHRSWARSTARPGSPPLPWLQATHQLLLLVEGHVESVAQLDAPLLVRPFDVGVDPLPVRTQAAQLLALGVRMSDENARRMRILQALGLIKLANNAVHFIADPA